MHNNKSDAPRKKLIVGLDVPDVKAAESIVTQLGDSVSFYKIGYQLAFNGGLELAKELIVNKKKIFLDMKLLDIETTIFKAVENIIKIGVSMLTLHAYPKVMQAASKVAQGSSLCLLGVTVLTSMNDQDLEEAGYPSSCRKKLVMQRARQAFDAGMGGIVCSSQEIKEIRNALGDNFIIVTPGIRPCGHFSHEHTNIARPQQAINDGASYIIIGRPIIESFDKTRLVDLILAEIEQ